MNNWLKAGLIGAAGAGLLAASGGTMAAPLAGILGTAGEGAAAAGTGAAASGIAGTADAAATTGMLAGESTAAATPATAFVTPPVLGGASAPMAGSLAGTDMAYGAPAAIADAGATAAPPPGLLAQAGGYAKDIGKAATAYGQVSNAMGGNQPPHQAPAPRPVFSGEAPSIAQSAGMSGMQPAQNQNALLAMIARRRQMGY